MVFAVSTFFGDPVGKWLESVMEGLVRLRDEQVERERIAHPEL